ncbi:MAG: putative metal-dependent hydrolase [Acidobacteria bacterium]|nr:MAG: putative metal-dependent hydrolase [Acidobacteriota bacterium]
MEHNERKECIRRIEQLPSQLEKAVANLSDQQLDMKFREGGWTVRQLVHHLADSHANAYIRLRLALTEDKPTIRPYNQDDWSNLEDARTLPVGSSLDILRGLHHRWVALMKSMPEKAWGRRLVHPERGEMSLDDILKIYAGHGEKHLEHIKTALTR